MRIDQVIDIQRFAEAVTKLKQARDREEGVTLTPGDVAGLIWGIQTLRGVDENADAADPS